MRFNEVRLPRGELPYSRVPSVALCCRRSLGRMLYSGAAYMFAWLCCFSSVSPHMSLTRAVVFSGFRLKSRFKSASIAQHDGQRSRQTALRIVADHRLSLILRGSRIEDAAAARGRVDSQKVKRLASGTRHPKRARGRKPLPDHPAAVARFTKNKQTTKTHNSQDKHITQL